MGGDGGGGGDGGWWCDLGVVRWLWSPICTHTPPPPPPHTHKERQAHRREGAGVPSDHVLGNDRQPPRRRQERLQSLLWGLWGGWWWVGVMEKGWDAGEMKWLFPRMCCFPLSPSLPPTPHTHFNTTKIHWKKITQSCTINNFKKQRALTGRSASELGATKQRAVRRR